MQRAQTSYLKEDETFNGYRILRVLGAGGFGVTYLAEQVRLERKVALKEFFPNQQGLRAQRNFGDPKMSPEPGCEEAFAAWLVRFAAEARTLVKFRHPNIVQLYDFFEANGTGYHAMEYVEGRSLKEEIRAKGALPDAELARLVPPLLDGLEAIHKLDFVHRDVKPDNIFIRADGSPILLDFGAARRMRAGTEQTSVTVMASPGFAPFEQYSEHGDLGPWTDIYALAATLYCAMTGRAPVDATKRVHAYTRGESDPLPPVYEAATGKYHPALLSGVQAGLGVLEADRPQSVGEWRRSLTPWLGRRARPPSRPASDAPGTDVSGATDFDRYPPKPIPAKTDEAKDDTLVAEKDPVPVPGPNPIPGPFKPPPLPRRPRWQWAVGAAVALAVLAGGAYAVGLIPGGGGSKTEEVAKAAARAQAEAEEKERKRREDDARRAAERKAEEEARKRAGEKAAAEKAERERQEAARRDSERKRREEEAARKAELDRLERAKREAEEAQRRLDEARNRMEEEHAKAEEAERRRAEAAKAEREAEERRKSEESKRKAEADAVRPGREFRDCPECPQMVTIPAGTFTMGSPASEAGREQDEGPQRRVAVQHALALGKYEVTRGEFAVFVRGTAYNMPVGCRVYNYAEKKFEINATASWRDPGFLQTDQDPVVCVNWSDANAYLAWLSRLTGKPYRLPSEAEWEYAARAGTTTPFHTGMTISTDDANYNGDLTYGGGGKGVYRERTLPVGSLARNAFGLYDMHGNVSEWVRDCWNANYSGAPATSISRESGDCDRRIIRGGSWEDSPRLLRSALRNKRPSGSGFRYIDLGFRAARDL